ncbi:GlxA family transcriptional regulator [Oryzibacter oryziterrae]|uniref:GlxA family transcriptional regulator n=1 Tax=Oryzibacter oryziterrae TaxID=2766474 RepID=UPI001F20261B|nr:GlxA family transcriptional regulator [Oryzibacter oryziterrae]
MGATAARGRVKTNGVPQVPARPRLSVGFILADNFTLSAFALFVDQLRLAADEGDLSRQINCSWSIMGARPEPVRSSCGVGIERTSPFTEPERFDYIAVVGGILHAGRQVDDATIDYLRRAARAGVPLIGLCTGSFVLARAGLMTGRRICVNWYHYQDFLNEFPHHHPVADRLFVVDGDRITCPGGGSVADLASYIVEKSLGRAIAQKSRQILVLDQARPGTAAQPHPPLADSISDERVRRALLIMEQHLADPLLIADIATRLKLSTRQLERLFHSVMGIKPAAFYRSLRLKYARWLLDNTDRSVTDIALESGFSDCAHFSRHFKALHGISPSDIRIRDGGRRRMEEVDGVLAGQPIAVAGHRLFE